MKNNKKLNNYNWAIVKTIAFFDMFDYPLTVSEIENWTLKSDNQKSISQQIFFSIIDFRNGYYFIKNRQNIIFIRENRYKYAKKKYKIAKRISKIFKIFPWIKMIAVCNAIGNYNLRKNGDIDLFIITSKNRLWLTKFFTTLITIILLKRPKQQGSLDDIDKKIDANKDKICLSFFITEDNLDLRKIALKKQNDLYICYWLINLKLIYNKDNTYQKLIRENQWINKIISGLPHISNSYQYNNNYTKNNVFCNFLEKIVKKIQLKIMIKNIGNIMNKNTNVIVTDKILKLHINDRREYYLKKFKDKVLELEKISSHNT